LEMLWASLVADGDFEMMDQPFVWHFWLIPLFGPLQNEAERSSYSRPLASKTQQFHRQYVLKDQQPRVSTVE
jgi:hypothetical protein